MQGLVYFAHNHSSVTAAQNQISWLFKAINSQNKKAPHVPY